MRFLNNTVSKKHGIAVTIRIGMCIADLAVARPYQHIPSLQQEEVSVCRNIEGCLAA
jgi:hypothetical protein